MVTATDIGGTPLGTVTGLVGQATAVEGEGGLGSSGTIDMLAKIQNIDLQGTTASTGGNETRPTNITMMYIIWR